MRQDARCKEIFYTAPSLPQLSTPPMLGGNGSLMRFIPGHGEAMHDLLSMFDPLQGLPPFDGAGLSHFLSRMRTPSPQVTLHAP